MKRSIKAGEIETTTTEGKYTPEKTITKKRPHHMENGSINLETEVLLDEHLHVYDDTNHLTQNPDSFHLQNNSFSVNPQKTQITVPIENTSFP